MQSMLGYSTVHWWILILLFWPWSLSPGITCLNRGHEGQGVRMPSGIAQTVKSWTILAGFILQIRLLMKSTLKLSRTHCYLCKRKPSSGDWQVCDRYPFNLLLLIKIVHCLPTMQTQGCMKQNKRFAAQKEHSRWLRVRLWDSLPQVIIDAKSCQRLRSWLVKGIEERSRKSFAFNTKIACPSW